LAQHSKARTKAEAQFKAGAEASAGHTADHKGRTGYGGLPRRGSCRARKDRAAEGT